MDEYLAPLSDSIWGSVMSSDFYHKFETEKINKCPGGQKKNTRSI